MISFATLFVLQFTLCLTIRVPIEWNDNSEVQNNNFKDQNEADIKAFNPHIVHQKPIPKEYFEYTAQKPHFAIDIAAFHGVKSPEKYYKAYPVRPYTGVKKPELGKHNIFDNTNHMFEPYRRFVKSNEHIRYVTPASSNFNIFHPYKSEEPALKAIYQDPVLDKIRNDLKDSKDHLKKYENDAGKPNIEKNEYLENPEQTDRKIFPHKSLPAQFEIHKPQRRPVYYMPPAVNKHRENILNHKIRHPWNENYAKITPMHYLPVKSHLQRLRQQHALKYDDEHNEYPQIEIPQAYEEHPDGYDIYKKGKERYTKLRHIIDESINDAVKENRPSNYQNLELQSTNNESENIQDDYEFAPVKNYAQVRKTETVKHLPRDAAFRDAETYDELQNAPRLREAIKSTKAQTVYSEEGYEDSAYDHAGEQKHASDHEGHGGYLKEKELSKGKYKIPTFSGNYEDGKGLSYRDNVLHGEKWMNVANDDEEQNDEEDYSEDDNEYIIESDIHKDAPSKKLINENISVDDSSEADAQHDLNKREANYKVLEVNLSSNYVNDNKVLKVSPVKLQLKKSNDLSSKFPYYNKSSINKDSPLRYAENFKNIPRKSNGGTEFYDSRTQFECPEVEEDVDPLPEKLKKNGHPDEYEDGDDENLKPNLNQNNDEKQRLKGLGDKIDCYKIKYFGENPLDSPFFDEGLISNPEPVTVPASEIFKLFGQPKNQLLEESQTNFLPNFINETLLNKTDTILPYKSNNHNLNAVIKINTTISSRNEAGDYKQLMKSRKRRATPFIYEPYKILRDSQIQDSKKTTTTSNISPLIKQLQSSRVIDRVTMNSKKDSTDKRNTASLPYKTIDKKDREKVLEKFEDESSNLTFINVNEDSRQSEPRFERRPANHKSRYMPVENKKSMSLEAYTNHTTNKNTGSDKIPENLETRTTKEETNNKFSSKPIFDVTKYLPQSFELQKTAASNKVKTIKDIMEHKAVPEKEVIAMLSDSQEGDEGDENYEEYDEGDVLSMTTTTTKPTIRKKIRIITTTIKPDSKNNKDTIDKQSPKLKLVTRFRNPTRNYYNTIKKPKQEIISTPLSREQEDDDDVMIPKYREKKRKSSQRTLVTDTKTYGQGNDDMKRDEVDELIGIKHDMEEYMPHYEKEEEKEKQIQKYSKISKDKSSSYEKEVNNEKEDDQHEKDDENGNIDADDDSYEAEDDGEEEDDEGDLDSEDEDDDDITNNNDSSERKSIITTEPTKRTLVKTTIAPEATTEVRRNKPIISKKKIEIHKELPPDKSSQNTTQFKQDIKEIEIIKKFPARESQITPQTNAEVLQLYKDENLAKEVNNFFDVEVFNSDLDIKKGPRHGGNYRSIPPISYDSSKNETLLENGQSLKDSESSQSKTTNLTDIKVNKSERRSLGGKNIKPKTTTQRPRRSRGHHYKLLEDSNQSKPVLVNKMHDGNIKLNKEIMSEIQEKKNEKLIELSEEHDESDSESAPENMHGGNFKTYNNFRNGNPMHGGNYRSAKITQYDDKNTQHNANQKDDPSKNIRRNSAALLDSFARAVPILTTTPAYILDPSKRMYYYVDS